METRSAASFSLLANGLALPRSCYDKGAYFLMVIFLAIAFVAPLVELLLYAVLWLAPLKQRYAKVTMTTGATMPRGQGIPSVGFYFDHFLPIQAARVGAGGA